MCLDCYPYSASSSTLDLKQVTDDFDILHHLVWAKPEHAGKTLRLIADEMNLPDGRSKSASTSGRGYHCMDRNDVKRVLKYKRPWSGSDQFYLMTRIHTQDCGAPSRKCWSLFAETKKLFSRSAEAIHKMTGMSAPALQQRAEASSLWCLADLVYLIKE